MEKKIHVNYLSRVFIAGVKKTEKLIFKKKKNKKSIQCAFATDAFRQYMCTSDIVLLFQRFYFRVVFPHTKLCVTFVVCHFSSS